MKAIIGDQRVVVQHLFPFFSLRGDNWFVRVVVDAAPRGVEGKTYTNSYKLAAKGGGLVLVDRWYPSTKTNIKTFEVEGDREALLRIMVMEALMDDPDA